MQTFKSINLKSKNSWILSDLSGDKKHKKETIFSCSYLFPL